MVVQPLMYEFLYGFLYRLVLHLQARVCDDAPIAHTRLGTDTRINRARENAMLVLDRDGSMMRNANLRKHTLHTSAVMERKHRQGNWLGRLLQSVLRPGTTTGKA
jgi:hypothetical protein